MLRTKIDIKDNKLEVLHAQTSEEITRGLSGIDNVDSDVGMLFHFKEPTKQGFWMLDTKVPLDIAFIKGGKIIDIQSMEPYSLDGHSPKEEYERALEVNKGYFEEKGITIGDTVNF